MAAIEEPCPSGADLTFATLPQRFPQVRIGPLVPTFRSSCYISAPTFHELRKSWALGRGLIKPEPEPDASDFYHCEIVESAAIVSGRDVAELLELVEAAFDEIALLVFRFAIGDAVVTVCSRRNVRGAVLVPR